jgi:hypothetical protein
MEFRTTFNIEKSADRITYNDQVMMIGSCFASAIGQQMLTGRMPVMINPAGTVFNPVSVWETIDSIISEKQYFREDLHCHEGIYLSFAHYTDFSSDDPEKIIEKINRKSKEASEFLKRTKFLFITFGTARVYRWRKTGKIVSNCHKIPSSEFVSELLSVKDIVELWGTLLDRLSLQFPELRIIFTISPVRHWKNGAHGNQVSKSVLFLAVDELLKHPSSTRYFPAYELVMDDLRDYRFYSDDMLHPSSAAIEYIWEAFSGSFMENKTMNIWREVARITKACSHRLNTRSESKMRDFATKLLDQISELERRFPFIELSNERKYFTNLLKRDSD